MTTKKTSKKKRADATTHTKVATPPHTNSQGKYNKFVPSIRKRNGAIVFFDFVKIETAIWKAMAESKEGSYEEASMVAHRVASDLVRTARKHKDFIPNVDGIQNEVERQLILSDYVVTAKSYIIYRAERTKVRQEKGVEISTEVKGIIKESSKYFATPYQEFIFYQFYSRWQDGLGRRETWIEAIDRYMDFMKGKIGKKLTTKEYSEVREAILNQDICPSMRLLWSAGKACEETNVCAYNCAYIAPTSWKDLSEIMYVSMCGAGCGFSVEPYNVEKFPQIQKQTGKNTPTIVVEDSKIGWCKAFTEACKAWEEGHDVKIDYSKIRPSGARLMTMGGRASGPAPLQELMVFVRRKILARQGRRLSTIDLHDIICEIGLIVVAGGVRRSALISLSALDDIEMRDAKKGTFWQSEGQRSMANNSVVYEAKPTASEFFGEWTALIRAGTGERGIFNRGGLEKQVPARRWEKIKGKPDVGVNPCVTKDTWVMTSEGSSKVCDLIGKPFTALVDGKEYLSPKGFFETGSKEVFRITTSRGFSFDATGNHKVLTVAYKSKKKQENIWKRVDELKFTDKVILHNHQGTSWKGRGTHKEGWLLGSLLGDGNIQKGGQANLDFWGATKEVMMSHAVSLIHETVGARSDLVGHVAKTGYARVQSTQLGIYATKVKMAYGSKVVTDLVEKSSSEFTEGFLQGWFDSDGSVQGDHEKGVSVRLASSSLPCLKRAQRMFARLGIISTVYENRRVAHKKMMPDGNGGHKEYNCKSQHELVIAKENIHMFSSRVGFVDPLKRAKLTKVIGSYKRTPNKESFSSNVVSVISIGIEKVYDCMVPGPHAFDGNGIYLHNCGEIYLQSKQFCNLTSIVVRPKDTMKDLKRKIRLATILGTYQATLTDFKYLSKEWKRNCEDEQLLGISVTGYYDNKTIRNDKNLDILREETILANKKYSNRFNVNQSTSITCVKPHGNSGQLLGVGSGMHPWFAQYYIRRVRISATDPLLKFAESQNVPIKPEVGYSTSTASTMVLEFPCKAPDGVILNKDVSALDLLTEWKRLKVHFTEHNPSVTIYVSDDEWVAVANFLYENWDVVGGLSFLPRNDSVYQLAPYEEITKAEYERLSKRLGDLDFAKLIGFERGDNTQGAKELACAGGTCEI